MSNTPNLGLPYLSEAQAQKEVTYNEMLNLLELLIQSSVISILNAPPAAPANGDMYIIGDAPTGAWAGKAKNLTGYIGGSWVFVTPKEGWRAWVKATNKEYRYLSGVWT